MQSTTRKLWDKLEDQLRLIQAEETHPLRQTGRCIQACKQIIDELKEHIRNWKFKDMKEEIHFFKEEFPRYYTQYIYYVKVYTITTNMPAGSDKARGIYLQSYLHRIKNYFDNNLGFYQYYRTGATHFDEAYFTRGKHDIRILPDDIALAIDPHCCTVQSLKIAKIEANELLRIYIRTALAELDREERSSSDSTIRMVPLQWTAPKVALIELIYSLQSAGVFNNANSDIKQITSYFEKLFQVDLGNVYNVFQEMRIRKKNRTTFLDILKTRLTQRMDEADEGY